MKDLAYDPDETIAALATPWGESALAVIRTSGQGSIDKLASVFSKPEALRSAPGNSLIHGRILAPKGGSTVDEVVLAVYRSPRSYTGQDSVEIFGHGSIPGVRGLLSALKEAGFRDAGPGEFTLRAFLNKKMDLTRAEAVHEIVSAKSREAQSLALHRLSGAVEERINSAKRHLTGLASTIEIQLDYPEDEVAGELGTALPEVRGAGAELRSLLSTYRAGRLYQEGLRVSLCGKTNAGKSSLFNLLLREERSIVSELHGTTRDFIESWITLSGIPISLFDTAGLRASTDVVEVEGIRRSERIVGNSDLVVYLVDAATGVTEEDDRFLEGVVPERRICVWNKFDLQHAAPPEGYLPLSAVTGEGLERITDEIVGRASGAGTIGSSDVVIDSLRQKALLERAVEALEHVDEGIAGGMPADAVAMDLREALDALGEITGEVTSADILNTMFANFCVGK
ncbi:MAG TPA: tRNA uridine-5-carboxymethylaminomethyl(34) synthesis GTPase MnmE [Spirochaetia bacterium]|nr:tRNA uridine-5-carboxymethylaminomethyl(34) synthesis GTPase MnmE [Spirochaetia bacterium]